MRSPTRIALAAAAAALAACGNYSTEDLRFLAALPTQQDLRVAVPDQGTPGEAAACGTGIAEVWLWAKPTSDSLNASVAFLLGLVDAVRRAEPSAREENARGWGPWDDEKHPGREIRVIMLRTYPPDPELEGAPRHTYVFQGRVKAGGDWTTILAGTFDGPTPERGAGLLVLDFDAIRALGMDDAGTPQGTEVVRYDRGAEPAQIEIVLGQDGFGVVNFAYQWAGWADGRGWFAYAFRDDAETLVFVAAGFDAAGAGDAQIAFQTAGGFEGGFRECWDTNACLVHVQDPFNFSCDTAPCSFGDVSACPAVPASPFPPSP